MLAPLRDVRTWSHERRVSRLKEISVYLEDDRPSKMRDRMLDEGVVILLETFRDAGFDPFQAYIDVLDLRCGVAWDGLAMRMLDTRELVRRFKSGGFTERANLHSKLSMRGMV